ncbi:MAG: aldehyde dehydrogenase [Rhodospirillaceae bacterium]|jgi:thiamine pyrophosphate-dependent acetolactate synthase large subunit-like protein|nr:aldehyde dehydrogenase [Rhodospirillaceae bacterium]
MTSRRKITLDRRKVVTRILKDRGETLLVTGLGAPTWDAAASGDHPNNFYLWGGMGGAVMTGLGLALAQPKRRVLVITGDGEMLMGLGGLATAAVQKPDNLAVCIIDNQRYGETGMQETHTEFGVDLPAMARGAGFSETALVYTTKELDAAVTQLYGARGPVFVDIKVTEKAAPMVLPLRDGPSIKHRFRDAVLGET